MKQCKGCGAVLQYTDKQKIGYTPKENSDYCQRCFRLIHYDDLTLSMRTGIEADAIIHQIEEMDALILWVVDLFDFEASMIPGLNRKITNKDILLVATKRDLFPKTLQSDKIAQFVYSRLKEYGIQIKELILTSKEDKEGLKDVEEAIKEYARGREVVVIGRANAGKSTLLNRLMQKDILTASKYPGTTLEMNRMEHKGSCYIDTPGIEIESSMLMCINEKDLRYVLPERPFKPKVFQLKGDQSFALGGLCRLDFYGCEKASVVFYCSDELIIHRAKVENADENWQKHYGKMYLPIPEIKEVEKHTFSKDMEKMDIVINGLGFASVHGTMKKIEVHAPKGVSVISRKAML